MKLAIIGLPGSGKTTIFQALTQSPVDSPQRKESRIGTVKVPDKRLDFLAAMYKPRKTIYAQMEYFLPAAGDQIKDKGGEQSIWTQARDCDALIHVVRNFSSYGLEAPDPIKDFQAVDQELLILDLVVVEKRLERLELDEKRGKKPDPEERSLLEQCREHLNNEVPLRRFPELASARRLKGYAFLSAKPMLALFNNADEDEAMPDTREWADQEICMLMRGKLEAELALMPADEAQIFLQAYGLEDAALDRVIARCYELMGLISFFTVAEHNEVHAWTIQRNTAAVDAAETVHTDFKKGFIRAEVLAYDDLVKAGTYAQARKQGTVRLEGKTYAVQDGDIIHFRFNV